MLNLPKKIISILRYFEEVFDERVWEWAKVLLIGAILAPGERTVAAVLRVMGQQDEKQFQNYHRVLNRAKWSSRALSRVLLRLLVKLFVAADAPIVVGIDETIERRRGAKIEARGIYRDPVRSSKEFFVKTSGLRSRLDDAACTYPLGSTGVGTAISDSACAFGALLRKAKATTQEDHGLGATNDSPTQALARLHAIWSSSPIAPMRFSHCLLAQQASGNLSRLSRACDWTPPYMILPKTRKAGTTGRPRLKGARQPTLQMRLIDPHTIWQTIPVAWYGGVKREVEVATGTALWYHTGMAPVAIRWVLLRDPEGKFDPQALLCTDQNVESAQIIAWFVLRWQLEVTFHEVRAHLGVETQRQWSDLAILRTTPALLAVFSIISIFAHQLLDEQSFPVRQAAWYSKALPTFSDTLAFVRQHFWPVSFFYMSSSKPEMIEIPRAFFERIIDTLAFTG